MSATYYIYVDAFGGAKYTDDTRFNLKGEWSSAETYATGNVVKYNNSLYMCLRDNTGDLPTRVYTRGKPVSWSILSMLSGLNAPRASTTPCPTCGGNHS